MINSKVHGEWQAVPLNHQPDRQIGGAHRIRTDLLEIIPTEHAKSPTAP